MLRLADSRQDTFCCISTSLIPSLLGAELQPLADLQEQTLDQELPKQDGGENHNPCSLLQPTSSREGTPRPCDSDPVFAGKEDNSSKLPLPKEMWWLLLCIHKQLKQSDSKRALRTKKFAESSKEKCLTNFEGKNTPEETLDRTLPRRCISGTSCSSSSCSSSSSWSVMSLSPERGVLDFPYQRNEEGRACRSALVHRFDLTGFLYYHAGQSLYSSSMWRYPWMRTLVRSVASEVEFKPVENQRSTNMPKYPFSLEKLNQEVSYVKLCLEHGTPIPGSISLHASLMVRWRASTCEGVVRAPQYSSLYLSASVTYQ